MTGPKPPSNEPPPPRAHHTMTVRVRYCECDPMGVAHHTAYPAWFEMGRTELCRDRGVSYRELEAAGVLLAVVELSVRYRRPARYDDLLELQTTLHRATRVKLEHTYRLLRSGLLLATGSTTLACLDPAGAPRALPGVLLRLEAAGGSRGSCMERADGV